MNIEKLLKPYKEGGTENHKVERTMGTIVDYLMNKKGYPLHIIGGAIFSVFFWLSRGNEFKGDGSYGSKGRELVTSLRMKCDELLQEQLECANYKVFFETYAKSLSEKVEIVNQSKVVQLERRFISWWHGRNIYNVST